MSADNDPAPRGNNRGGDRLNLGQTLKLSPQYYIKTEKKCIRLISPTMLINTEKSSS